jgi:hypothetical protein
MPIMRTQDKTPWWLHSIGETVSNKIDANDIAAASGALGLAVALDGAELIEIAPTLRNFRPEEKRMGKRLKVIRKTIPLRQIVAHLKGLVGSWPKRIGSLPFYLDAKEIKLLESPEKLFAWVQAVTGLSWGGGLDEDGGSLVSKQEFYAHVCQGNEFEQYRAAESLPHWPRLPAHFYTWAPPADYVPDGRYFNELVEKFGNAESAHDAAMIRALFLAPAWGGPYGARPAWVIEAPDRGCGKTQLANVVGRLYGGYLDFDLTRSGEEDLATRLLSEGGLTKRIVRVDNVKRQAGSGLVENLITSDDISGKRLFHGEASRPNTLCWIITANGLRMSRDMSERSFIVRLRRLTDAERCGTWRQDVLTLIDTRRDYILADIGWILGTVPAYDLAVPDRWTEFVQGVLSQCFQDRAGLASAVALNQVRRNSHDDDLEEALAIQEAVDAFQVGKPSTFIGNPDMVDIVNGALNLSYKLSACKVRHTLKEHIEAGRLMRLGEHRSAAARGWVCTPEGAQSAGQVPPDAPAGPSLDDPLPPELFGR